MTPGELVMEGLHARGCAPPVKSRDRRVQHVRRLTNEEVVRALLGATTFLGRHGVPDADVRAVLIDMIDELREAERQRAREES